MGCIGQSLFTQVIERSLSLKKIYIYIYIYKLIKKLINTKNILHKFYKNKCVIFNIFIINFFHVLSMTKGILI